MEIQTRVLLLVYPVCSEPGVKKREEDEKGLELVFFLMGLFVALELCLSLLLGEGFERGTALRAFLSIDIACSLRQRFSPSHV